MLYRKRIDCYNYVDLDEKYVTKEYIYYEEIMNLDAYESKCNIKAEKIRILKKLKYKKYASDSYRFSHEKNCNEKKELLDGLFDMAGRNNLKYFYPKGIGFKRLRYKIYFKKIHSLYMKVYRTKNSDFQDGAKIQNIYNKYNKLIDHFNK